MDRSYFKLHFFYIILMVVLIFLSFFNIFYDLGRFPIFSWDEARHGVNAFEMLKNRNFIVSTYRSSIDYWNLKPPLSLWATIAGFKIAGFNALGLRLFSAISAFFTIIAVVLFTYKTFGKLTSFFSCLSLTTCTQFLINHSARTGDADSLFVFCFTLAVLSLLLSKENLKWLYVSGFAFSLAFLTKSWHAGSIIIIMFLYLTFTGKYRDLLLKNWLLLSFFMLFPISIWGIIRFQYDGVHFFERMVTYDLLRRSSSSIEGHFGDWNYYFKILWLFSKYWIAALIGMAVLYVRKNFLYKISKIKSDYYLLGIILWVLTPLLLFTLAETKIRWYILPIYPALSILIGILAARILTEGKLPIKVVLVLSIFFISMKYEYQIQTYIHNPIPKYHIALLQNIEKNPKLKGYHLFKYFYSKPMTWEQNTVLAAELYNNLQVEDGGFQDFLKQDRALLLLKKRKNSWQFIRENNLHIVTYNKWGYLLSK